MSNRLVELLPAMPATAHKRWSNCRDRVFMPAHMRAVTADQQDGKSPRCMNMLTNKDTRHAGLA